MLGLAIVTFTCSCLGTILTPWSAGCTLPIIRPSVPGLADVTLATPLSVTTFAVIGTLLALLGALVQRIVLLALVALRGSVLSARFAVWLALGTLPIVGPAKGPRLLDLMLEWIKRAPHIAENRGLYHSTLNSRILIIRTPK